MVRDALARLLPDARWPDVRRVGAWWPRSNTPDAAKVPGADASTPLVGVCPVGSNDARLAQVWRVDDLLAAWPTP